MADNGEVLQLPTIVIGWDEATKAPHVQVNWEAFKTYEFAEAVVRMALSSLETARRAIQIGQIQQKVQEQAQTAAIVQELKRGRIT